MPVEGSTIKLWTRDHEIQLFIISEDAGRCSDHQVPLAYGMFAWDHRITDPMYRPGPFVVGEDRFPCSRHADGSVCLDHRGEPRSQSWSDPRCPGCKEYNVNVVRQEAYGDDVTCTKCDYHEWHSIGD